MGLLDKLKGLFKIDLPKFESFIKIQIGCDNSKDKIVFDQQSKDLNINLAKLDASEKNQLGKLIRSGIQEEDYYLIERESNALLEDFTRADGSQDNQEKLAVLREALPHEDVAIWRASLFLASSYQHGKPIDRLKEDILRKYGDRGRKISNLCSAGYLEEKLIPYFQEIMKETIDKEAAINTFRPIYRTIVDELQITVFVSRYDNAEDVAKNIEQKILKNWRYGLKVLNIHAINKLNVKKAKQAIEKIEEIYDIASQIEQKANVLTARLEVKSNPSPQEPELPNKFFLDN